MILAGHGSNIIGISGGEESQQSQASLFNSGSELANSMELFSQPYSASHSSISQHSQIHSTAHVHQFNTHTGTWTRYLLHISTSLHKFSRLVRCTE